MGPTRAGLQLNNLQDLENFFEICGAHLVGRQPQESPISWIFLRSLGLTNAKLSDPSLAIFLKSFFFIILESYLFGNFVLIGLLTSRESLV